MRFEKIDNKMHIILEDNDKICITTEDKKGSSIEIAEINSQINISGNANLISSIRGEGMLEKIYLPPVVSSEKIIEKCDEWLDMFKKVHDKFKSIVLNMHDNSNIAMVLSFARFFSFDNDIKGFSIDLDIKEYGQIVQEGITISIEDLNSDIYAYLMANVLDYYITQNYEKTKIDDDWRWEKVLYSYNHNYLKDKFKITAFLSTLYDEPKYADIASKLLNTHNLDLATDQIIGNLKSQIKCQPLPSRLIESIDYSKRQCKYIITDDEEKTPKSFNRILKKS